MDTEAVKTIKNHIKDYDLKKALDVARKNNLRLNFKINFNFALPFVKFKFSIGKNKTLIALSLIPLLLFSILYGFLVVPFIFVGKLLKSEKFDSLEYQVININVEPVPNLDPQIV